MMKTKKVSKKRSGFTIVELLTVMGVIAILIGLLVPALAMVHDYAKEVQQKAQFHSIEVAIGMFKMEFGMYPPSNDNLDSINPALNHPDDATPYGGANKLAEAMVGLDMLGYHANSDFRSDGLNLRNDGSGTGTLEVFAVYHPDFDDPGNPAGFAETMLENVQARKSFIELENANAFEMQDVYLNIGGFRSTRIDPSPIERSLVLCDVYAKKRQSAKKAGMPILYYKARTVYTQQNYDDPGGINDDIYYYVDNYNLLVLGVPEGGIDHPLADGATDWEEFENMILNKQVTQVKRPYRAESYILMSAGKDGVYGSPDDIFNFKKEQ